MHFARICVLAFLILCAYGVVRPVAESRFLAVHGSAMLPWAWVGVAVAAAALVAFYQRAARHLDAGTLLGRTAVVSVVSLAVIAFWISRDEGTGVFALYVWKDVHVVLLIEALWTSANLVFQTRTARWAYGLFCAAGSVGDLSGSLLSSTLEKQLGFVPALAASGALLALTAGVARLFARRAPVSFPPGAATDDPLRKTSLAVLRRSDILVWMIAMVFAVQVAITLVDFLYNQTVEREIAVAQDRTEFIGNVYAAIAVAALALQFGSALVLRFWGAPRTLVTVPAVLLALVTGFVLMPSVAVMVVVKVASKAFDYSVYRTAKEVIYIPLDYEEKTHGKALGDMLTYRVAKAGASLLLVAMVSLGVTSLAPVLTLVVLAIWVAVASVVGRRYLGRLRAAASAT